MLRLHKFISWPLALPCLLSQFRKGKQRQPTGHRLSNVRKQQQKKIQSGQLNDRKSILLLLIFYYYLLVLDKTKEDLESKSQALVKFSIALVHLSFFGVNCKRFTNALILEVLPPVDLHWFFEISILTSVSNWDKNSVIN